MDPQTTAQLVAAAADITFVLDAAGMIKDVAFGSSELAPAFAGMRNWVGRDWAETITPESQSKAREILAEAGTGPARARQVNQLAPNGPAVALMCTAARAARGQTVIFGRDLRPLSSLQQQLIEALQAVERDYGRLRQMETRYRVLFQMSAEPVLLAGRRMCRCAWQAACWMCSSRPPCCAMMIVVFSCCALPPARRPRSGCRRGRRASPLS